MADTMFSKTFCAATFLLVRGHAQASTQMAAPNLRERITTRRSRYEPASSLLGTIRWLEYDPGR